MRIRLVILWENLWPFFVLSEEQTHQPVVSDCRRPWHPQHYEYFDFSRSYWQYTFSIAHKKLGNVQATDTWEIQNIIMMSVLFVAKNVLPGVGTLVLARNKWSRILACLNYSETTVAWPVQPLETRLNGTWLHVKDRYCSCGWQFEKHSETWRFPHRLGV